MQVKEKQNVIFASINEMMPLIIESVESGNDVELSPRGVSMLPMLREGKDSVIITSPSGRLKKYDIPLYRRSDGVYVLHRVVKVGEFYACVGDGQYILERVSDEQVVAVVKKFRRGNRLISTSNIFYRIYAVFWTNTRPVRLFCFKVKRKLKRILKKKK